MIGSVFTNEAKYTFALCSNATIGQYSYCSKIVASRRESFPLAKFGER